MMGELGAVLEFRRPFYWGVVLIGDPEAMGVPDLGPEQSIAAKAAPAVVPVRHAQDSGMADEDGDGVAPFEVSIRCSPGVLKFRTYSSMTPSVCRRASCRLGTPTPRRSSRYHPGDYRLQITIVPVDHAERVHVWYSPS